LKTADLAPLARDFAGQIQDLLNRTITHGIRITTVLYPDGRRGWVGFQINKQTPYATQPIPVTISQADPKCFLVILHRLELDPENVHIATTSSRVELHLTDDLVEAMIVEELAIPHNRWQEAVEENRQRWVDLQLSAAVRRNPEVARRALAET